MKKIIRHITSRLYSDNDFIIGIGSVLNISGSYFDYNYSSTPEEADRKAIQSDWLMVGQDLYDSMDNAATRLLSKENI